MEESLNSSMVISMIFTLGSVVTLHMIKYGVFSKIAEAWTRGVSPSEPS